MHVFLDLRQELAVRERTSDVARMSAPSSPTLDIDKTDSAAQASLSLPATPVGSHTEHPFIASKGLFCHLFLLLYLNSVNLNIQYISAILSIMCIISILCFVYYPYIGHLVL